jgi:hypothetical protein
MRPAVQNAKLRPVSDTSAFFQAVAGFAIAALVMAGVAGTVYKLVAPGGWFAQLFDRSLAGGMGAILALLVIGLCAFLMQTWVSVTNRNRFSELFVYVFAAAGALYSVELLIGK